MNIVKCCNCNWQGIEEDLVQFDDKEGGGFGCPNCGTDYYLSDQDENNYDIASI